jgi:hypothetical protein
VAAQYGGTIVSSQTYRANNAVYTDLVLSVPSERFEDALDELRGLGEEVTTDTVSGQDVTEEYVDLQSRERNLLAAEQSLLDLYNRADDVQDALSIQRELTGIRGQIEQVQGRMQYLKQSSDTSQVSLSITPVASPPKPPPAWDPALVVAKAWTASLAVLRALAAAILSMLVFGWWIIPRLPWEPGGLDASSGARASRCGPQQSPKAANPESGPCEGHVNPRTAADTIHCMW